MAITEFKEIQRFKRWWVWVMLLAVNGIFAYAIVQQVIFDKPFGNTPMSNTNLLLISFIPLSLLVFVFSIRLDINISSAGIRYRYYPFQLSETLIEWEELSEAYMRKYSSFYEYGGWGIRVGNVKTNRAINTSASCNIGLQLEFKNGSSLLIGTRRPNEIKEILNQLSEAGKIGWKV
jgi:hypothetical protein